MNVASIACVVEGDGEVQAVPVLIRRIAQIIDPGLVVHIPPPVKVRRNRLGKSFGDLEVGLRRAIAPLQPPAAVLILLDSDDDCPAHLGPALLQQAVATRGDVPIAVVLAKREFEGWFLAAAESVQGKRGLQDNLQPPADPEAIRDAKGWLRDRMPSARKYVETRDQPALTAVFDLDLALNRSDSFDKCYREITRLLTLLQQKEEANSGNPEA